MSHMVRSHSAHMCNKNKSLFDKNNIINDW